MTKNPRNSESWVRKTPEEREAFRQKMSRVMKEKYSNLTKEDRGAWSKRSSISMNKFISVMSKKERVEYGRCLSEKAKKQDLTKFKEAGKVARDNWRATVSDEEYAAYKAKLSTIKKEAFAKMSPEELHEHMLRSIGPCTSKIEIRMVRALRKLGYKVVEKYKIGRHVTDAYIPELNTVVEMNGDYWHGSKKLFSKHDTHPHSGMKVSDIRERDKRRKQKIENRGFKVIIAWESDLKEFGFKNHLRNLLQGNTEPS